MGIRMDVMDALSMGKCESCRRLAVYIDLTRVLQAMNNNEMGMVP
jgi:hypothetical protein